MDTAGFLLGLLNGVSFGMVLFLVASGLSVIFGLMGILNMAHGALYMVGAYVGWTVAVQHGLSFGLATLAGGIVAALVGLVIERGFLRHLYKQPNAQVLLTFGFIYILANLSQWIWGPDFRGPFTAPFLSGSFQIVGRSYPTARIGIIFIGLLVAVGLWWLQNKTRVGAIVRAGMDNKEMTGGLGINLARVSMAVFFFGFIHSRGCWRNWSPAIRGTHYDEHRYFAVGISCDHCRWRRLCPRSSVGEHPHRHYRCFWQSPVPRICNVYHLSSHDSYLTNQTLRNSRERNLIWEQSS